MQTARAAKVRSEINVTPLVDVVLVLLIIFMVITPMLATGPAVRLPLTEDPPDKPEHSKQIPVAIEQDGTIWLAEEQVSGHRFARRIQEVARGQTGSKVVIKGDARLSFGEVKRVMFAVNEAGFKDVGLIAEMRGEP